MAGARGLLEHILYCAESVLLSEYRGQRGSGTASLTRGRRMPALWAQPVRLFRGARATDHPLRPKGYRPRPAIPDAGALTGLG